MQFIYPHLPNRAILLPKPEHILQAEKQREVQREPKFRLQETVLGPRFLEHGKYTHNLYYIYNKMDYKFLLNIMKSTVSTKDDFFSDCIEIKKSHLLFFLY